MADGVGERARSREAAIRAVTARGEPFEVETAIIGGRPLQVFRNGPRSLRDLYAAGVSDKTFIVYETERLTFAQAYARSCQIAQLLGTRYGVRKGDRVAIAMRNYPEWMLAFAAITSLGAIAVALNALWPSEEMERALGESDAKVLFADAERLERLDQMRQPYAGAVIAVRPGRPDARDLAHLVEGLADDQMPVARVEPDDPALILYTSGSTGDAKGAVSSHRNVLTTLLGWELETAVALRMAGIEPQPPARQPAMLLAAPLFHAAGSHAAFLMSYRAQRKLVCMYKWDPAVAAELIERERITSVNAPSAMTGDLVREAQRSARDLTSLVVVGGGGAARAPEQVREIASTFAGALPTTGWGMTETNALGTGIGGPDYLARPTSAGRGSPLLELKIVDDQGRDLPAGQPGELLVRGASVFQGYWKRPEVTAEAFRDGWFRTGDIAHLDADGYLFIVDRLKDLVIRGGEKIGAGRVEAALLSHPEVIEAAVYAVPDARLGEEVGATVFAAPGLEVEALKRFLADHLAAFEIPRHLTLTTDALPRLASGKIDKAGLRRDAAAASGLPA